MAEYDVLKVLTLATLLWVLFFLNLILSRTVHVAYSIGATAWNLLYVLLLVSSLIATLVVVGESIRNFKKNKLSE